VCNKNLKPFIHTVSAIVGQVDCEIDKSGPRYALNMRNNEGHNVSLLDNRAMPSGLLGTSCFPELILSHLEDLLHIKAQLWVGRPPSLTIRKYFLPKPMNTWE
jgi:hypothetical protein